MLIKSILFGAVTIGMSPMFIDTHVHTSHSDGLHPPEQVIRDAALAGVGLMSVTDHDCVDAYPAAFRHAKAPAIGLIPGVELDDEERAGL